MKFGCALANRLSPRSASRTAGTDRRRAMRNRYSAVFMTGSWCVPSRASPWLRVKLRIPPADTPAAKVTRISSGTNR